MKATREMILPEPGSSFACLLFDMDCFDNPYHYHPEVEITWIVESEGQRLIGDALDVFQPGDLVMIGANVPHQYRNWELGRARSRVIQFLPNVFGTEFFETPEFHHVKRMLAQASRGIRFSEHVHEIATRKMRAVFHAKDASRRALKLIDLLMFLASDLERIPIASTTYAHPIKLQNIERMRRVMELLDEKWDESVDLEEVARVASLHPHSVSRFFQQHLGVSFREYLIQLRIQRASQLLLETDRTVADIAYSCGFRNLSNFNRQFRRVKCRSPREFRG